MLANLSQHKWEHGQEDPRHNEHFKITELVLKVLGSNPLTLLEQNSEIRHYECFFAPIPRTYTSFPLDRVARNNFLSTRISKIT